MNSQKATCLCFLCVGTRGKCHQAGSVIWDPKFVPFLLYLESSRWSQVLKGDKKNTASNSDICQPKSSHRPIMRVQARAPDPDSGTGQGRQEPALT